MGWHDDEEQAAPRRLSEPVAWIGCLLAAAMPTAVLASLAQAWDHAIWPVFTPLLYIGMFTVMVLIVRPWSMR